MSAPEKFRWFAFVVYPDSAPEGWWDLWCVASHGEFCRSPLHHGDGDEGKNHYHVMYHHPNTVRVDYVRKLLEPVAANGYVEPVVHPSNMMRYLVHMDSPDKERFEGDPYLLCECCGGFPLDFTREYSASDRREQRKGVLEYIRVNGITEYAELVYRLAGEGLYDYFDYACNHTIFISHLLMSLRHGTIAVQESDSDNLSYVKLSDAVRKERL